jgi:tyrosyl-tRNA synthetase
VGRFLRLFTELPLDEIARLEQLQGAEINEAKKILADHATAMVHGRAAAEAANETARKTFEEGTLGGDLPTIEISDAAGLSVIAAITSAGFAKSNSEARRLVQQGAVSIDGEKITDMNLTVMPQAGEQRLTVGKKKIARLVSRT